ncbi:hypothetical protein CRENBAI_014776 [Crenichthys baileyi]|uniref:Dynein regulatory complex subunit 7 C-terminal domain-containing protein n=1 Tax=Crenichthys baileyi TaxID=28760 RepID=A0AAV9QV66_9TELE
MQIELTYHLMDHRTIPSRRSITKPKKHQPFTENMFSTFRPPPALGGLPESLRGQPVVLLHGLTELLQGPSFCHCHSSGRSTLGLTVPVSRLRSPTSQPQPIGLPLQLDSIPYCRCPSLGSGIAAATGTADLMAAATGSSLDNRCGEHGPLRLYVSNIPRNLPKALPEVGVEYIPGRGLRQAFAADPHYALGPAKSVRLSPPPADPTHQAIVVPNIIVVALPALPLGKPSNFSWSHGQSANSSLFTPYVEQSKKPLGPLLWYSMVEDLINEEENLALQIKVSLNEMENILDSREQEEKNLKVFSSELEQVMACREKWEEELTSKEDPFMLHQQEMDALVPILTLLESPDNLNSEEVRSICMDSLAKFKERLEEHTSFLQKNLEMVIKNQEANEDEDEDHQHDPAMSRQEAAPTCHLCWVKNFPISAAQRRLDKHKEKLEDKCKAFLLKLHQDPLLAPHFNS